MPIAKCIKTLVLSNTSFKEGCDYNYSTVKEVGLIIVFQHQNSDFAVFNESPHIIGYTFSDYFCDKEVWREMKFKQLLD